MRKIPLTIQNIFIYQFNYIIDLQNIPVLNYSIKDIKIKIQDRGALEYCFKARVETALRRACN